MKTLKDIPLKRRYDPSLDDDVVNDFYVPCLSVSNKYDRVSAYFSSAVLKQFSKGLVTFFKNNEGRARFIFSCHISNEEMVNIVNAYTEKMTTISEELDENLIYDYEVANLSYLIKHSLVDVKIAFMLKNTSSLVHHKLGLFSDSEGNKVYFEGSGNETESGIMHNAEKFTVFKSFEKGDIEDVKDGEETFEKLWNNTYNPKTIFAHHPVGPLFEKLISFSRDRLFTSEHEFFNYLNCVYIDLSEDKKEIILFDYTSDEKLKRPMILKSNYINKITEDNKVANKYIIRDFAFDDLRDNIPEYLRKFNIKYIFSEEAREYIYKQDLDLEKRIKVAESIKTNQNLDLWENPYNIFKLTVDFETNLHLKPMQMINAFHHYCMKSSLDFSVPGTGKTFIAYGLFAYLNSTRFNKKRDVDHLVVFGPLNCFKAWRDECVNIFKGKQNFSIFDISRNKTNFEYELKNKKFNIYLFNYEFLTKKDKTDFLCRYVLDDKTLVVFDEIHKLKSIHGVRSTNVVTMFKTIKNGPIYKLALTGTPMPNSFLDIFNYIKILYPNDLNGYFKYCSKNYLNRANSDKLAANNVSICLHPIYMRTKKEDLNIPPANEDDTTSLSCRISETEEELYKIILKTYKNKNSLLKFIRLIQASSNPSLIKEKIDINVIKNLFDDGDDFLSKFDAINEYDINVTNQIQNLVDKIDMSTKTMNTIKKIKSLCENKEKVIVRCLFIGTIELVAKSLANLKIGHVVITGSDNLEEREEKIEKFKNDERIQVIITNPNTLAESVSLHHVCHNAIYLEYGFNLTYLLQSKDRIHRVGLKPGTITNYYFAVSETVNPFGSIDRRIYNRLLEKEKRMISVIENNTLLPFNDSTDKEDILAILSDSL